MRRRRDTPEERPRVLGTPARRAAALGAILALAAVLRIIGSPPVYTPGGVRLGPDSDPYYHLLRARELAVRGDVVWRDPGMNYPAGADVLWPPGFDALIAATAWVTAGGRPTDAWVERVAPAVPVALGVASVVLVALLGAELLGGGLALGAAVVLAAMPAHLQYTALQRPDQHAAEVVLFPLALLLLARALRGGRAASLVAAGGAGLALALAFWNWQGSAVNLVVLAAFAATWHVAAPEGDPARRRAGEALAVAGVGAAGLLAASIAALAPPGALARGSLTGISALSVALCLAVGAFGAGLGAAARRPRSRARRAAEVAIAAAVPLAALAALPAVRDGIAHGLAALAASNAWYHRIREYQPLVGSGSEALSTELLAVALKFGVAPVAVAAGVAWAVRLARRDPSRRAGVVLLLVTGAVLLVLALARRRFEPYLAIPVALLVAPGLRAVAERWSPARARAALVAGWALVLVPWGFAMATSREVDPVREAVIQLAQQIGDVTTGAPRTVLAAWDRGHDIRYFSGLPVIATPFGTDLGPHALDDAARFWLATSEAEAEEVLAAHGVRWVLLEQPEAEIALGQELLHRSGFVLETSDAAEGAALVLAPAGRALVSVRLYDADGAASAGAPALGGFRLVQEVAAPGVPPIKVFEVVRGAVLRVVNAAPGAEVEAATELVTPDGRGFAWAARALADTSGAAAIRVPYATGANGAVGAAPYAVRCGGRRADVQVPDGAVRSAVVITARLP